ncbi:MAG: thermonuclease family protein [Ardenticatenaceae bacterium]
MRRKSRFAVFVAVMCVWIVFSLWALGQALDDLNEDDFDIALSCRACSSLEVVRVIDGDTFVGPKDIRVRLYGVNTPERGERCFNEAAERLRELAGDEVRVEQGPRRSDTFGRSLYYAYTNSGESIDARLVREGFGHAWTQDGQHRDVIAGLENEARADGTGCLW